VRVDEERVIPSCTTNVDHIWTTQSKHWTTDGMVVYQRCECGMRQVLAGSALVVANFDTAPVKY